MPKILTFTLAISCLTTFSLPWFMDLTFQVLMQHCSLQHWTSLSPPDTFTTEHHSHFGQAASFFLKLLVIAVWSSPTVYWTPSNLRGSPSSVIAFCLFIRSWGSCVSNTSVVCHPLLQGTTFCLGWPRTARLIASLSYASPFGMTRLWPMKGATHTLN